MKAETMLFRVVRSASLSRLCRKHYLPSNLENRKSWNPSVNSATVIFGAKLAVTEPRYGNLKAFLGPKMTKTRSKQPKMAPNHPKNGQKWCRNSFEKIDFGSFWVILGHFGSFWAQKMTKHCLQKPNMTPNHPHARKMAPLFSRFVWKIRIFTNFAITDFKIG